MVTTHPRATTLEGAASVYGRACRGWLQEDLADALTAATGRKWDKRRVSRLERGEYHPRSNEAIAIAEVLDLPIEFVLYGADSQGGGRMISRKTCSGDLLTHLRQRASHESTTALVAHVPHSWVNLRAWS